MIDCNILKPSYIYILCSSIDIFVYQRFSIYTIDIDLKSSQREVSYYIGDMVHSKGIFLGDDPL